MSENQASIERCDEGDPQGYTLRGVRFFQGLPKETADAFTAAAIWYRFPEGQMIFDQDSSGREVYFIVQGRVRLLTAVHSGEPVTLAEIGSGEIFGEFAALDHLTRSARAVAATETILGSIEGPVFIELIARYPTIATRILQRMAAIIRAMDVRLANIAVLTPTQRVIAELMRRAEPDRRVPGMWIIPYSPSHGDIATWTGMDRDEVAQVIGVLARDALLRRRGGSLVLMDWAALKAMVKPLDARVKV